MRFPDPEAGLLEEAGLLLCVIGFNIRKVFMTPTLRRQSYGKHRVRISKIKRPRRDVPKAERHEFVEVAVDIELEGDFEASYTQQDNSNVIATDTCRNTVYILGKDDPLASIESFGMTLSQHFIRRYSHVSQATIRLTEHCWHRLLDSPHAFIGTDSESPTASIVAVRGQVLQLEAGIERLMIAKTTESGFSNFHRDEYRTLPDTSDRILATELRANWRYSNQPSDFTIARETVRRALLASFIDHYSHSVQETLYKMAGDALKAQDDVASITLTMPNKHHLRFDLASFHRSNDNEVFVVTDEPSGFIQATVDRS